MVKNLPAIAGNAGEAGSIPGLGKILWSRKCQSAPISSVQFSSVAQSCPTLCNPMSPPSIVTTNLISFSMRVFICFIFFVVVIFFYFLFIYFFFKF